MLKDDWDKRSTGEKVKRCRPL